MEYPSCVFFGTVIGYNFLKYYNVFWTGNFNSKKYYWILTVSILATVGFLFFFLWLKRGVQINLLISGVAVLVYPFLRKYGWLKLFLVSIVVTYVTVFIPFQNVKLLPIDFYVSLMQRFFILTSLLIPFEFMVFEFLKPNPSYVVLLISIITAMFIKFTSLKRNQYYTSFWVESIPILWLILLMVFQ